MPAPENINHRDASPWLTRHSDAQSEASKRRAEIHAAAERGLWALADLYLPTDVREAATRWQLENVLPELWRSAFIQGWRASQEAERRARAPATEQDTGGAE